MVGGNGEPVRPSGQGTPRYFGYLAVLSQCIVLVGYILPWYAGGDGMLLEAYSDFTGGSLEAGAEVGATLVACFSVTVASLVFACYSAWTEDPSGRAFRVSSLSASVVLAGPLVHVQLLLQFHPEWPELYQRLQAMQPGWYVTLLFGTLTAMIGLYVIARSDGPSAEGKSANHAIASTQGAAPGPVPTIPIIILAFGSAVASAAFFQTWASGEFYSMAGAITLRKSGVDEAPLMCVVLAAIGSSLALSLLSLTAGGRVRAALLTGARNAAAFGLAMTALWGLVIGDLEGWTRGFVGGLSLQPGWYVFLGGQVLAVAGILLIGSERLSWAVLRRPTRVRVR